VGGGSAIRRENALRQRGLCASKEVPVIHRHAGQRAGTGYMDLVVESRVVVEVKNIRAIREEDLQQLKQYMQDSGLPVGVVLNFGCPEANLELPEDRQKIYRRLYLSENDPRQKG
jgi:GxxExxY protein